MPGVSGDTAEAGLARLDWAMPKDASAVIIELGGNDALQGLPPEATKHALEEIITRVKARGLPILLAGMEAPRNLGEDYVQSFDALYPDLAAKYGLLFYPFFLDGVAMEKGLTLDDGMHPNAARGGAHRRRHHAQGRGAAGAGQTEGVGARRLPVRPARRALCATAVWCQVALIGLLQRCDVRFKRSRSRILGEPHIRRDGAPRPWSHGKTSSSRPFGARSRKF